MAIVDGHVAPMATSGASGAIVAVYGGHKAFQTFDDGVAQGVVLGTRPEAARAVKGRTTTFIGKNTAGQPDAGLTPSWVVYLDAVANTPQSSPTIQNLGGGNYGFTPTGSHPAGLIDLGAAALPRYFVYSAFDNVWVFAIFDVAGQPLTGVVPTWYSLKKTDLTNYTPQPSFSELSGGLYKTTYLTERVSGVIDAGASANPRYIPYSNDKAVLLIPVAVEG